MDASRVASSDLQMSCTICHGALISSESPFPYCHFLSANHRKHCPLTACHFSPQFVNMTDIYKSNILMSNTTHLNSVIFSSFDFLFELNPLPQTKKNRNRQQEKSDSPTENTENSLFYHRYMKPYIRKLTTR